EIIGGTVTDAGFVGLKSLKSLGWLEFTGTVDKHLKITGEGFQHLADFADLKYIYVRAAEVTDSGLARICQLGPFEDLQLGSNKITDAGLVHLSKVSKIDRLGLGDNPITGTGLKEL